jgi:hypothetical protein
LFGTVFSLDRSHPTARSAQRTRGYTP